MRARRHPSPGRVGQILVAPAVGWLTLVVLIPIIMVLCLAAFAYNPLSGELRPVGTDNVERLVSTGELVRATKNTVLYTLLTVIPIMTVGLLVALGIRSARVKTLWRTAYFLPTAATLAGMSVVWRWMFYPYDGVVDRTVGLLTGWEDWLNSSSLALPAIAVVGCWQGIGAAMIMFLAGLSSVPEPLLEAARLDGARSWSRFWAVYWPALGPATTFVLITTTRDALRVFDQVAVMTAGGPYGSSETLAYLMWQRGVAFSDIGGASVVNAALLVLVLLTVVAQLRVFGRRWEKAGSR